MVFLTVRDARLLEAGSFYVTFNGHLVDNVDELLQTLDQDSRVDVHCRVLGGKGGFSSLLRSFRIYRSTNQEMCRDLTGRRLKDVKEEERLKKWVAKAAERENEKKRKRDEKYEKLKAGPGKHDFSDIAYERAREDMMEKNDDALEHGLKEDAAGPSSSGQIASGQSGDRKRHLRDYITPKETHRGNGAVKKAKRLKTDDVWLGVDALTGGFSSDSSDDDSSAVVEIPQEIAVVDIDVAEETKSNETVDVVSSTHSSPVANIATKSAVATANTDSVSTSEQNEQLPTGSTDGKVTEQTNLKPTEQTDETDGNTIEPTEQTEEKPTEPAIVAPKASNLQTAEDSIYEAIDLEAVDSLQTLLERDAAHLKRDLEQRGLKCGGLPEERARRLWAVKGLAPGDYPKNLKAKKK